MHVTLVHAYDMHVTWLHACDMHVTLIHACHHYYNMHDMHTTCMLPLLQHACHLNTHVTCIYHACNRHVTLNMHVRYCKHACYMQQILTRDITCTKHGHLWFTWYVCPQPSGFGHTYQAIPSRPCYNYYIRTKNNQSHMYCMCVLYFHTSDQRLKLWYIILCKWPPLWFAKYSDHSNRNSPSTATE